MIFTDTMKNYLRGDFLWTINLWYIETFEILYSLINGNSSREEN